MHRWRTGYAGTHAQDLVLLALLVAAGCGGDDDDGGSAAATPAGGTPQEQVTATVDRYFEALADGDGEAFCAELTPEATKIASGMAGVEACEDVAGKLKNDTADEQLDALRDIEVTGTTVSGDQAEARIALGGERAVEPIKLQRHDGAWKVSSLATSAGAQRQQATRDVDDCTTGGLDAFDAGETDPFWEEQGRTRFQSFISAYCREAVERLADSESEQQAIRDEVIADMVERGQIPDPG